jgi:hypothetical protein
MAILCVSHCVCRSPRRVVRHPMLVSRLTGPPLVCSSFINQSRVQFTTMQVNSILNVQIDLQSRKYYTAINRKVCDTKISVNSLWADRCRDRSINRKDYAMQPAIDCFWLKSDGECVYYRMGDLGWLGPPCSSDKFYYIVLEFAA